jgi:hypothetical protein
VRLSDVREIRLAYGGTVNDVVLAVIAHGFRELLEQRGEPASSGTIRTLVPVSVRPPGDTGAYNRVSALFADLPVGIVDPVARLAAIQAQLRHLKESNEAVAGEALTSLAGFAPELLLALSARLATRTPQRNVNTVTTNVPGPQVPLYLAGRRMPPARSRRSSSRARSSTGGTRATVSTSRLTTTSRLSTSGRAPARLRNNRVGRAIVGAPPIVGREPARAFAPARGGLRCGANKRPACRCHALDSYAAPGC